MYNTYNYINLTFYSLYKSFIHNKTRYPSKKKKKTDYQKGKYFDKDNYSWPYPVKGCSFDGFANTFSKYDEKLKTQILRTALDNDEECRPT